MQKPAYDSIPDPFGRRFGSPSIWRSSFACPPCQAEAMDVETCPLHEDFMKPMAPPPSPTSVMAEPYGLPPPLMATTSPYDILSREPQILTLISLAVSELTFNPQGDPATIINTRLQELAQVNPQLVQFVMQHPQDLWALCRNYSAPVAQTFAPAPASPQPPPSLAPMSEPFRTRGESHVAAGLHARRQLGFSGQAPPAVNYHPGRPMQEERNALGIELGPAAVQVVTATGSPRQLAVQQLVSATGSPWQFCAQVLEKCGNDPQRALDSIIQRRQRLIAHCNSCIDPACQTCQKVRAFLAQHQQQQRP